MTDINSDSRNFSPEYALKDRRIEYVPIDSIKLPTRRVRRPSKKQQRKVERHLQAVGQLLPLLITDSRQIIAGEEFLIALRSLGATEVPVIRHDHLSEAEAQACSLALRRLAEEGSWDQNELSLAMQDILAFDPDFDLTLTAFDTPEIDFALLGQVSDEDADSLPPLEEPALPTSRQGDLWVLGGKHRLMCGDSLDPDVLAELMSGEKAAMSFVDLPYNVQIDRNVCGSGSVKHREFAMASGEMSSEEFEAFLLNAAKRVVENSLPGSMHFRCMDWRHIREEISAGTKAFAEFKNLCVWVKDNGGMGSLYRSQHELVFVYKNGRDAHVNNVELGRHGRNRTNVWHYPGVSSPGSTSKKKLQLHPTVKPVAMAMDAILDCSDRNLIILDTFVGSGTTIIAAEKTGRRGYGIEIDPTYVDTAIRRWMFLTDGIVVHAETGKTFAEMSIERAEGGESDGR